MLLMLPFPSYFYVFILFKFTVISTVHICGLFYIFLCIFLSSRSYCCILYVLCCNTTFEFYCYFLGMHFSFCSKYWLKMFLVAFMHNLDCMVGTVPEAARLSLQTSKVLGVNLSLGMCLCSFATLTVHVRVFFPGIPYLVQKHTVWLNWFLTNLRRRQKCSLSFVLTLCCTTSQHMTAGTSTSFMNRTRGNITWVRMIMY